MSVTYDRLWALMKQRGVSRKELLEKTGITAATFAQLTHDKIVSLETIVLICQTLQCDIGDVVSIADDLHSADGVIAEYVKGLNDPSILRNAVLEYMQRHELTKTAFTRLAGISPNTLRRILDEEPGNLSTYRKLMAFMSAEIIKLAEK